MRKYFRDPLDRRFTPLYIAASLQGIVFWYAIEKVFMKSIGFDDRSIATAIIIFTVVTLLANIPIGILADRWSRKGVLMLASCLMVLACVIGGFSTGITTYIVAACLAGLFYACYQGIYDSVVYDALVEDTNSADDFGKYYGKVRLYDGIALAAGSLLSAVIVHYLQLRATYFLTIPFAVGSIISLHYFREPKEHKKQVGQLLRAHVRDTFRAVMKKGEVFWIVLALVLVSIVMKLILDFDQLWFIAIALPLILYGPFDAILLSSFTTGGFLSDKFKSDMFVIICGAVCLVSSLLLLTEYRYLIIVAQTVIVTGMVVCTIIFERFMHDRLASSVRVGAASVVTTIGLIVFLPIAYLFGEMSDRYTVFQASWVIIVLLAASLASGFMVLVSRQKRLAAKAASRA